MGPNRIEITSKSLVHNYNMRSSLTDFRDTHKLNIPRLEPIDVEFRVATTRAAPPEDENDVEPWPTVNQLMRENPNITGTELMVSETFLRNGVKKRSMMIMMNRINMLHGRPLVRDIESMTLLQMHVNVQREFPLLPTDGHRERLIKDWIHYREWLDNLKSDGITLLMHCFLDTHDARNAPTISAIKSEKMNYYLDHIPVQVEIQDPHGNFYMDIKRKWKYSELLAKIAHRRLVGGNFSNTSSPYVDNLQQCFGPLVNGSTIHLNMRIPSAPPSAEDCPGSLKIFVRGFGTLGSLYVLPEDTFETLRIRLMNVPVVKRFIDENIADFLPADFFFTFDMRPVTGGTVSENSIYQDCTLQVSHRPRGGAKKGIKKLTKQEKLAALRATTPVPCTGLTWHRSGDHSFGCSELHVGVYPEHGS